MNKENIEDITFKLLANPSRLKKKDKKRILMKMMNYLKIKNHGMVVFKSDKIEYLKKLETILTEITIANIVDNIVKEIEYE